MSPFEGGEKDERECPNCGAVAFCTMNAGDIGTAIHLRNLGLSLNDFEIVDIGNGTVDEARQTYDSALKMLKDIKKGDIISTFDRLLEIAKE